MCRELHRLGDLSWLLVNMTQPRIIWEMELHLRNCIHKIGLWASLLVIFLIRYSRGKIQQNVVGTTPGQVVLGCIRIQAEQAMRKKTGNLLQGFCFSFRLEVPTLFESVLTSLSDGLIT